MARKNNWGAPHIYSELLMLGFTKKEIFQSIVLRYLRRFKSRNPDHKRHQSWTTFLKNHREAISAMDLFVVPTVNFTIVYVFFIIEHAKRKIIHFNITEHPTAQWVMQQLRNAFPFDSVPGYLIFDRAKIFSPQVKQLIKNMNIDPKVISYKVPWQNSVAERWILSTRYDMLNHLLVLSEEHLTRLLREYDKYYFFKGDHDLSEDPCFVNPAGVDYTLDANSPCIDAGKNYSLLPGIDQKGNSRAADGDNDGFHIVDMGAYEFAGVQIPDGCITLIDSDYDGIYDELELEYFNNLYRDGNGDINGNGLCDKEELQKG